MFTVFGKIKKRPELSFSTVLNLLPVASPPMSIRRGGGGGVQLHVGYLASTAGEEVPAHGTTKDRSGNIFFSLYHQVTWTMATPMKRGGEEGRSMAGYPTILSQVSLKVYPCIFSKLFSIYFLMCWQGEFVLWVERVSVQFVQ